MINGESVGVKVNISLTNTGGFGQATQIEFEVGTYKFTYNSETHVTTYQKISE